MSFKKTINKSNAEDSNGKRAKELVCLYAFSSLVVKNNITVDEILQGTIDLIPPRNRLPDMDGLEFFKRIQKSHPNAFKILTTAYGSKELLSKVEKNGIHDFIEKPFTSETIEKSLFRLIY